LASFEVLTGVFMSGIRHYHWMSGSWCVPQT